MVIAAEDFYHALCSASASTHCLYGLVNVLFVLAAGLHLSDKRRPWRPWRSSTDGPGSFGIALGARS